MTDATRVGIVRLALCLVSMGCLTYAFGPVAAVGFFLLGVLIRQ